MVHVPHHPHSCQAIVISCMDFRLRKYIAGWTSKTIKNGFDRVAIAGGIKNFPFVLEQVELSIKLHHVCEVYMINHEDCGAYGDEGTPEKHKKDLLFARRIIKEKFPKLKVVSLYLKLDGTFVPVEK